MPLLHSSSVSSYVRDVFALLLRCVWCMLRVCFVCVVYLPLCVVLCVLCVASCVALCVALCVVCCVLCCACGVLLVVGGGRVVFIIGCVWLCSFC